MDPKQQFGARFQGAGSATAATATVSQGLSGGGAIYITDISGSSDVGTATLSIYDGTQATGSIIWRNTISATVPYQFNFIQPLQCSATAEVYISGASTSLKTVNVTGYII